MEDLWYKREVRKLDEQAIEMALTRQATLTKPLGSLGRLEEIGVKFSGWQGVTDPRIEHIQITVFAGDHGVAEEGISAFPQQVTVEMIKNFSRGGAAISVLARQWGAEFSIVNMGTVVSCEDLPLLVSKSLGPGTKNFSKQAAMTSDQLDRALQIGAERVSDNAQLFIGGEMGIGNTSSASAIGCAFLGQAAAKMVGRGTGIDDSALQHKTEIIDQALVLHGSSIDAFDKLRCFGGFEIAALVGAYIACAQKGIPILIDGFISTAAAVAAVSLNPGVRSWMLFSHKSQESGHTHLLDFLDADPLLDFQLRLGEGSGAALCVPLLQSACVLQSQMATFEEAAVTEG